MAKVFTTVPGLTLQIGSYGLASNTAGAEVPEDVALGFEDEIRGYREEDVPDPENPGQTKKERVAFGRGPNTQLRVGRGGAAPALPVEALKKASKKEG